LVGTSEGNGATRAGGNSSGQNSGATRGTTSLDSRSDETIDERGKRSTESCENGYAGE
jgi:hypothetical protein